MINVTFSFESRKRQPGSSLSKDQKETLRLIANGWAEYIANTFGGDTADELSLEDWTVEVK
jgi:hypothetical protein